MAEVRQSILSLRTSQMSPVRMMKVTRSTRSYLLPEANTVLAKATQALLCKQSWWKISADKYRILVTTVARVTRQKSTGRSRECWLIMGIGTCVRVFSPSSSTRTTLSKRLFSRSKRRVRTRFLAHREPALPLINKCSSISAATNRPFPSTLTLWVRTMNLVAILAKAHHRAAQFRLEI